MKEMELIILISGGFLPITILESGMKETDHYLKHKMLQPQKELLEFGEYARVFNTAIVGWYFRPKVITAAEKLIGLVEKQVNDSDSGNEWKDS
jgi:hypothetical protein